VRTAEAGIIAPDLDAGAAPRRQGVHMHLRPRWALAVLTAAAISAASAGPAVAGPNDKGQLQGAAPAAPLTKAYEAPRPAGTDNGRKIG
jgi:hypothetical protein